MFCVADMHFTLSLLCTFKWCSCSKCCQAVEGATKALQSFKGFIEELSWPEETFAVQLELKVAGICAQRFQESAIL